MPPALRITACALAATFSLITAGCASSIAPAGMPVAGVPADARATITILISIDGYRADYLRTGMTPRIDALADEGAYAAMRPSFPSKTFPNHWTLVTGKRPDRHGITANRMEDPHRPKEVFTMASDDPFWWSEASPIWVDAEKAGVRSATMFWPGSNVAWGGTRSPEWPYTVSGETRPQDWQAFSMAVSDTQRVNTVLDWVRRPAALRPRFLTLYFDTLDTASHIHGPHSAEARTAAAAVDAAIGNLVDSLRAMGQNANLIITSDHGMTETSAERVIAIDSITTPSDYRVIEAGPYMTLEPMPGRAEALERALLRTHENMECWRKSEIPVRLQYGTHPRIPAYFCLAKNGWVILPSKPTRRVNKGEHGYDNAEPDMAALFLAVGPDIRRAGRLPSFDNVDVYPLLASLIGIKGQPGDGNAQTLAPLILPKR